MFVVTEKTVLDNKFKVILRTIDDADDQKAISSFGEPSVDVGGAFTGPPAFSLPTASKKVNTGFPFTQIFDGDLDAAAESQAVVWATEVSTRIGTEMTTVRAKTDSFTNVGVASV